jgi:hypothetical protein
MPPTRAPRTKPRVLLAVRKPHYETKQVSNFRLFEGSNDHTSLRPLQAPRSYSLISMGKKLLTMLWQHVEDKYAAQNSPGI